MTMVFFYSRINQDPVDTNSSHYDYNEITVIVLAPI